MRALRFDAFGPPSVLRLVDLPDPEAGDGFAIVRVTAASINPSDVKNVGGAMEGTTLPRTPGRDFAGVVEQRSSRMGRPRGLRYWWRYRLHGRWQSRRSDRPSRLRLDIQTGSH